VGVQRLPTGTVTFLFTDVEGSTVLLRELGADGFADALAGHRAVIRASCAEHDGIEVDTQGDSFFVVFSTAPAALAAATAFSAELAGGPVRVRAGVHTGTPLLTDDGYVGLDVHRAARIAAAGHGGQVLVSAASAALAPDASLRDLGLHWFKDLAAAERVYQLDHDDFPPLKSLYRTSLPTPASSFLGREAELGELHTLLTGDGARVVTLTGPGGTGKTRLAIQAAADASDSFPDGSFWVELAPLREPSLTLAAVGAALALREEPGRPIAESVLQHMSDKRLLLVLDNAEHLLPDLATDVRKLSGAGRRCTLLVTSRERLQVAGEQAWPVPTLARQDAERLFVERARAAGATLEVDDTVIDLCRRLDDLPLAIELTAARTPVLTPRQLVERLGGRLDLLRGGRDADPRQATLRATIDWSYELLDEDERRLFMRLATFAGSFTLEAAERVCECDVDTLASLVDKSLVRRAGERFWMLETIREYATELLTASAEAAQLGQAHARYYLELAEAAEPELSGVDQVAWLDRLAGEYDNLRLALHRLHDDGEHELELRLAASLALFWFVRGHYSEGVERAVRAIDASMTESAALGRGLWTAGFLEILLGDALGGAAHLERGLAVARAFDDRSTAARILLSQGLLAFFQSEVGLARRLMEESVELARTAGDLWCLADALGTVGSIYPLQGELELAEHAGAEALGLARRVGDLQGTRMALFGLALGSTRAGELAVARERAAEGLEISRTIGDPWFTSYFLWILAAVSVADGDPAQAQREIDESLAIAREIGHGLLLACALEVQGRTAIAGDDLAAAQQWLDEAAAVAASPDVPKSYAAAVHLTRGELARRLGRIDAARSEIEHSLQLARECDDRWAEQHALEALG
jgi:predicted ATPase/class 3 adenylate cyclase